MKAHVPVRSRVDAWRRLRALSALVVLSGCHRVATPVADVRTQAVRLDPFVVQIPATLRARQLIGPDFASVRYVDARDTTANFVSMTFTAWPAWRCVGAVTDTVILGLRAKQCRGQSGVYPVERWLNFEHGTGWGQWASLAFVARTESEERWVEHALATLKRRSTTSK